MFGVNPLMGVDEARASAASPPDEATGDATDMVDEVAGVGVVTEVETTDCRFVLGGMLFTTLLLLLLRTLLVAVIMEAGIVVVVVDPAGSKINS